MRVRVAESGRQDPAVVTELPPGCASGTNSNCANTYFSRWLACSTLSVWCTPSEARSRRQTHTAAGLLARAPP